MYMLGDTSFGRDFSDPTLDGAGCYALSAGLIERQEQARFLIETDTATEPAEQDVMVKSFAQAMTRMCLFFFVSIEV